MFTVLIIHHCTGDVLVGLDKVEQLLMERVDKWIGGSVDQESRCGRVVGSLPEHRHEGGDACASSKEHPWLWPLLKGEFSCRSAELHLVTNLQFVMEKLRDKATVFTFHRDAVLIFVAARQGVTPHHKMVDIFQLKPYACVLASSKPHGFVAVLRSKVEGGVQAALWHLIRQLKSAPAMPTSLFKRF